MPNETTPEKPRFIQYPRGTYGIRYRRLRSMTGELIADRAASPVRPTGTVTFLFTDIEGSVPLWETNPQGMKVSVAQHHTILRQAVEANGGVIFKIIGDAIQAAFSLATQGLAAALAGQRRLAGEAWGSTEPIKVRMGLHTGTAELIGEDYAISHTLNRVARVMSVGYGGQILLSQETADLVQRELPEGCSLMDLGEHMLKGLRQPEHLYQVTTDDLPKFFPPLISDVGQESYNLLQTKLTIPPTRPGVIHRERLINQLEAATRHKLALISAPAGFGKTTLLLEWASQTGMPVAWLTLDQGDNDPRRFWLYVVKAMQTLEPVIGRNALAALQSPRLPSLESIAATLINDISRNHPCILVLDDFHWIQSKEILDSLNFLLDHLPPQKHLVITTREDPPLQLPLRRARREMIELRTSDLRFTREETSQFLKETAGMELSQEDIDVLENRTEGWIAGLQMANLSLQEIEATERHGFITAFTGDDRYIVDYLAEEVLQRQPEEMQSFLLSTSILHRMCGPLCDALTGGENGQALLERLERVNLFIVPLDNRRSWYRYHPLFASLLQKQLTLSLGQDEIRQLHRRASQWYEQAEMPGEAIVQAMGASDFEYAADLIERHVYDFYFGGETVHVYTWLKALPEHTLRSRPLLSAVYAAAVMLVHSFSPESLEITSRWLDDAEAGLEKQKKSASNQSMMALASGFIANGRAFLARYQQRDPRQVIDITQRALEMLPEDTLMFRSALWLNLGVAYFLHGDSREAQDALRQAHQIGRLSGDLFNGIGAIFLLERELSQLGRLNEAMAQCREAYHAAVKPIENQGRVIPIAGTIYASMGSILLEWNELDEAEQLLRKSRELLALTTFPDARRLSFTASARLCLARGELGKGLDLISQAELAESQPSLLLQAWRARLWLAQAGEDSSGLTKAIHWAETSNLDLEEDHQFFGGKMILVRLLIAQHRAKVIDLQPVHHFLNYQLQNARQKGYLGRVIEVLILQALAYQAEDSPSQALAALEQALRLAEPEGYMRLFLDEGPWMANLLQQGERYPAGSDHVSRLLEAFESEPVQTSLPYASKLTAYNRLYSPAVSLVEPLSHREIEVLQLVADGASNPEIAAALFITINTVKKHVTNLFGKLEVTSRTQAVKRGQELGVIH